MGTLRQSEGFSTLDWRGVAGRGSLICMGPTYVDRHRITFSDLLIGALVAWVFVLGIISTDPTQIFMGLAFVAFLAYTRHRRYEVTSTELVIKFLGPRQSIIPLADIKGADLVKMPMSGTALMVMRQNGRRVAISPTDPERFLQELRALMGR
jgi:hypothetical protein